jgi:hypothetical protein
MQMFNRGKSMEPFQPNMKQLQSQQGFIEKENELRQRQENLEKEIEEQEKMLKEQKEQLSEPTSPTAEDGEPKTKRKYVPVDKTKITIPTEVKNKLEQLYYRDGYTLGRDALWEKIKEVMPEVHKKRRIRRVFVEKWLDGQEINQIYRKTRISKGISAFHPTYPLHDMSVDLIDYTNKMGQGMMRYVFVFVDNFSRYMWAVPIRHKTAEACGKAMESIFKKIKEKYPKFKPAYILSDDGSEFKGEFTAVLNKWNVRNVRTLAGQPQSNGLV